MRWIAFAIAAYVATVLQTTLGHLLTVVAGGVGSVGPDILAGVAVFVCLTVRDGTDALLAAWVLGFCHDLTNGGGPDAVTTIGPMALAYVLAGGLLFRIREAFFRDRAGTRMVLGGLFALVAHAAWVTLQSLLAMRRMAWGAYGAMMLQVLLVALYTGALTPIWFWVLTRLERWLVVSPPGRGRR
jgi:cell shape-determining protein MreD